MCVYARQMTRQRTDLFTDRFVGPNDERIYAKMYPIQQ